MYAGVFASRLLFYRVLHFWLFWLFWRPLKGESEEREKTRERERERTEKKKRKQKEDNKTSHPTLILFVFGIFSFLILCCYFDSILFEGLIDSFFSSPLFVSPTSSFSAPPKAKFSHFPLEKPFGDKSLCFVCCCWCCYFFFWFFSFGLSYFLCCFFLLFLCFFPFYFLLSCVFFFFLVHPCVFFVLSCAYLETDSGDKIP